MCVWVCRPAPQALPERISSLRTVPAPPVAAQFPTLVAPAAAPAPGCSAAVADIVQYLQEFREYIYVLDKVLDSKVNLKQSTTLFVVLHS